MTRSTMREHIFRLLFRAPFFNKSDIEEQIEYYFCNSIATEEFDIKTESIKDEDYLYIKDKTLDIVSHVDEIDLKINEASEGWPIDRIGKTELSIMRLAVYEMFYDDDIPVNVAINEAVELAKKYGSADSTAAFVNKVLDKLIEK